MSKERELLKRWFNDFGIIQADIKLLRETQELLAQPEQEDIYREPLTDEEIYSIGNKYSFHAAVREIERIHGIGE